MKVVGNSLFLSMATTVVAQRGATTVLAFGVDLGASLS